MAKLWPPKDWPKVAAPLILRQFVVILATFFEIWPLNLLCSLSYYIYLYICPCPLANFSESP